MMKKHLIILLIPLLISCAGFRQITLQTAQEDEQNVITLREVGKILHRTWPMSSGMLKVIFEDFKLVLPGDMSNSIIKLDELALVPEDQLTDEQLGEIVARRAVLITKQAMQMYKTLHLPFDDILGALMLQ